MTFMSRLAPFRGAISKNVARFFTINRYGATDSGGRLPAALLNRKFLNYESKNSIRPGKLGEHLVSFCHHAPRSGRSADLSLQTRPELDHVEPLRILHDLDRSEHHARLSPSFFSPFF